MDRRVERTRSLLRDSLRKLLQEKTIEAIGVADITEAANVNRATFYDHFADKFALFNALIAADFRELLQRRNVQYAGGCASGLAAILMAVGDFLEQVHGERTACASHPASGSLVDAAVTLAVRDVILDGLARKVSPGAIAPEVFAAMLSGAIYGAVKECAGRNGWRVEESAVLALTPRLLALVEAGEAAVAP